MQVRQGRHRFGGGLSATNHRRWLAAFPKGFGDLRSPPLGVAYFFLVRLPGPAILENVENFEKSGGCEEFFGCLPRRSTTPVFVICGGENLKGKVFDVCRGRALYGDGIRGSDGRTETLKHGEESSQEVAVRWANSLERDADLGRIVCTPIGDNWILRSCLVGTLSVGSNRFKVGGYWR